MPYDGMHLLKYISRILAMWAITALALIIIANFFPNRLSIEYARSAIAAAAMIGLLNALIWPILIRIAMPIAIYSFGIFILVMNGIILYLASSFVPGFNISSVGSAILVTLGVSAITTIFAGILSIDQDDDWWSRITQRRIRKIRDTVETDVPGILFLEIDGLSEPVFRRALQEGKCLHCKDGLILAATRLLNGRQIYHRRLPPVKLGYCMEIIRTFPLTHFIKSQKKS